MTYQVTASIDSLDPNPDVFEFDDHDEAVDFIYAEIDRRINFMVEHSSFSVSQEEIDMMFGDEYALFRLEEIVENNS